MVICHKDNLKGTRDLNSDMLFENKGGTLPKVIAALRKASDTDIVKVASKIAAMEDPLNLHS